LDPVTKAPADCNSKDDVRTEIDRIDQGLHEAYDPTRIEAIIAKQRKRAEELDLDEDQAELIWRTLINWNVNYEKGIIAARKRHG
jgi:isochorismate pyruvate lyase